MTKVAASRLKERVTKLREILVSVNPYSVSYAIDAHSLCHNIAPVAYLLLWSSVQTLDTFSLTRISPFMLSLVNWRFFPCRYEHDEYADFGYFYKQPMFV